MECAGPIAAPTAADVARGVARMLFRGGWVAQREVPLGNGRRADLVAISGKGEVTLVEIKVSMADLRGDTKWRDYLGFCDRFYWAVPIGFPRAQFADAAFGYGRAGLIVADAHDGAIVDEAQCVPLAGARRRAELLRFARRAGTRLLCAADPAVAEQ